MGREISRGTTHIDVPRHTQLEILAFDDTSVALSTTLIIGAFSRDTESLV